jgi:hypothetical protein
MPGKPTSLDDIFNEVERENEARTAREIAEEQTPEGIARKEAERAKGIADDIRKGLRNADGDWIEPGPEGDAGPEVDEPEDDEDEDGEDE